MIASDKVAKEQCLKRDSDLSMPSNIEAERCLFGSILLDPTTFIIASEVLVPGDFYMELHRQMFMAMVSLNNSGDDIDIPNLYTHLCEFNIFEAAGGVKYLMSLSHRLPSAINIRAYVTRVKEASMLRSVIDICVKANVAARRFHESVPEFVENLSRDFFDLVLQNSQRRYCTMREATQSMYAELEELCASDARVRGVPSGFKDLDKMLSGFRPGTLSIIAARPGMGKTAFAINILASAAIDHAISTAIFSLEMTKEELSSRLYCSQGKIDGTRMRDGALSDADWVNLNEVTAMLVTKPIFINEESAICITRLQAIARQLKIERGIGLIIVDYLQLMRGSGRIGSSREQEISEISQFLKGLAKDLHIPIIALSQLNRCVESRQEKRPILSDLRESGAIEQDADNIMFIYRDDYYNENSKDKGISEIIIAKQRSGPTGVVKLRWFGEYTLFQDLDTRNYPNLF